MNAFYSPFHSPFRRTFVTFCTLFGLAFCQIAFAQIALAQDATTSSTRSTQKTREITRALRPEIVNRLRDDNVLITQDVQHADKAALQRVARSGNFPTYIVMTRLVPHPYKNAFTLARDIRLQLDVSSNAVVIVATEADGYLGVNCEDIEYSMSQQIASRSALSWTNEGYTIGAGQTLRLVAAEREVERQRVVKRYILLCLGFGTITVGLWLVRRRFKK